MQFSQDILLGLVIHYLRRLDEKLLAGDEERHFGGVTIDILANGVEDDVVVIGFVGGWTACTDFVGVGDADNNKAIGEGVLCHCSGELTSYDCCTGIDCSCCGV